jgi:peptidoglycan-associated lipoprotein
MTTPDRPAMSGGTKADFVGQAKDRVYFGYDQHTLSDEAKGELRAQAAWLTRFPGTRIQVEGNADERGTREYNLALGLRRAEAVKTYLVGLGVAGGRIDTHSWGKDNPLDGRHSDAGWSVNRNAYTNVVVEQQS